MSHVDEGTLHAYLDVELPGVEAERVRTHVDGCAACHARLDEERALIERANRLLERAAPPDTGRPIPALGALAPRSGRRLPYVPLAWAATIVLAVGLGWYLRGPGEPAADAVAAGSPMRSAPPITAAAPTAPPRVAVRADQARVAEGQRARLDGPVTAQAAGVADRAAKAVAETALALDRASAAAPAPSSVVRQAPAAPAAPNPIVPRDEVASKSSAANAAAPREQAAVPAIISNDAGVAWSDVPLDSARAILGGVFATIPGFAIGRIQASTSPQAVVLVTLTPDSRNTIQLFERRAETDQRTLQRTSQRLARYVDGLRVEITGTVGPDSLSRLLDLVQ